MNEKYIPLYRKYRPQTLEEVVGQEHIKKALANAISLNKISHAYLFTGPRGTGKTSTARIFAKSLNCKEGPTIHPCGKCENCIDITNSTPMDVIEIDAASNRKVEDAQNILEKVMYAPVNSRYKIYIIDEVHMLSSTAFNALLKTLEEPPKNVIFILATTEVHKVLDTIKSRCQRYDFKRITTADIVAHLRMISDKEGINITDDALMTIAKNSAGGMRDSIALLDQLSVLDGKEAITTNDINNLLGRLSFDVLNELTNAIVNSAPNDGIAILEKIYNSGNEPVQILTNLLDYLKNLLIVKTCSKDIVTELTQLNDVQLNALAKQIEKLETHQIVFLIDKCSEYIKELKTTNNPRLWLEVAIIDLSNLAENTSLIELQNRISRLEGGAIQPVPQQHYKTAPAPVLNPEMTRPQPPNQQPPSQKPPKPQPPQENTTKVETESQDSAPQPQKFNEESNVSDFSPMPMSSHSSGSNDISVLWGQLLDNIQNVPTRALLKQWANPIEISPDGVTLTLKSEVLLKQFVEGSKKQILQNAVDTMFGQQNIHVIVRLPQASDVKVDAAHPKSKPVPPPPPVKQVEEVSNEEVETAKEEIKETVLKPKNSVDSLLYSDTVNMVMELFDGKIIE